MSKPLRDVAAERASPAAEGSLPTPAEGPTLRVDGPPGQVGEPRAPAGAPGAVATGPPTMPLERPSGVGFGALTVGARLGRYVLSDRLGAGAMGVVYAAHDPSLHRSVAIKVVQAGADPGRLLDEARTLARLSHPNVVPVYDAALEGEHAYVVMERLDGGTLATWLEASPRPWAEIVERFLGFGRGLAAAHTAGVVHRDVKPGNVLIDAAGTPRVADFGLALRVGTRGAVEGTVPYVAPEVWAGAPVDARSDQFAFAAAMLHALTGRFPPASRAAGAPAARPARGRLPRRLLVALRRGADHDPARRWPTMRALLDALEAARGGRRRWVMGAAAFGLVTALSSTALVVVRLRGDDQGCAQERAKLDTWFEPGRRAPLIARLANAGPGWAADAAKRVDARLDEYALAWRGAHQRACQRSGPQTVAVRVCLARDLDALEGLMADADHSESTDALTSLPGALADRVAAPARCEAEARPGDSAEASALRRDLALAEARGRSGRYAEARELAREVLARARASGLRSVEAAALYWLGSIALKEGASDQQAAADLETAFYAAERVGDDALAADAAISLISARSADPQAGADLERWLRFAEARLERLGEARRGRRRANLLGVRAEIADSAGRQSEALALYREELALRTQLYGEDTYDTLPALVAVGMLLSATGHSDEALLVLRRALATAERFLGPRHPVAATVRLDLANVHYRLGQIANAIAMVEAALAIRRDALGAEHPTLWRNHSNLGVFLIEAGRLDEARAHFERALALREAAVGAEHADVATVLVGLGGAMRELGHLDEADRLLLRALRLRERVLPPGHMGFARVVFQQGRVALDAGRLASAEANFRRAAEFFAAAAGGEPLEAIEAGAWLALVRVRRGQRGALNELERAVSNAEATLGASHRSLVWYLDALAEARGAAGLGADAVLERAQTLASATEQPPRLGGEVALRCARARVKSDRESARTFAALAAELFARQKPPASALADARRLLEQLSRH